MKKTIRHGGTICCDIVTVTESGEEIIYSEQCDEKFVTYSLSRLTRSQAAAAKRPWTRTKVKLVKWPGLPPMADGKKVDICPKHARLIMTVDEFQAKKKAERDAKKAEKIAAKAVLKKPRKKRELAAETQGAS